MFGPHDRFRSESDLQQPASPDGFQYGTNLAEVNLPDTPGNGGGGPTGGVPEPRALGLLSLGLLGLGAARRRRADVPC